MQHEWWEQSEKRKSQKRRNQKKESPNARKVGKSRNTCFFPVFRSISRSGHNQKVHAAVARSTCPSQNGVTHHCGSKLTGARGCGTKHISRCKMPKNTSASEHFWKLSCRKSAHRCDAKRMSKSKWLKHFCFGTLLGLEMSKKCMLP